MVKSFVQTGADLTIAASAAVLSGEPVFAGKTDTGSVGTVKLRIVSL